VEEILEKRELRAGAWDGFCGSVRDIGKYKDQGQMLSRVERVKGTVKRFLRGEGILDNVSDSVGNGHCNEEGKVP
jgi:hypothetical protein